MSNFERLKAMDSDSFTEEVIKLFNTPFRSVIDWKAYMRGESQAATDYIVSKGIGIVYPTDAELIAVLGVNGSRDKEKSTEYIRTHSKKMPVLEKTAIFDNALYTVADIENNRILKVPARFVEFGSEENE